MPLAQYAPRPPTYYVKWFHFSFHKNRADRGGASSESCGRAGGRAGERGRRPVGRARPPTKNLGGEVLFPCCVIQHQKKSGFESHGRGRVGGTGWTGHWGGGRRKVKNLTGGEISAVRGSGHWVHRGSRERSQGARGCFFLTRSKFEPRAPPGGAGIEGSSRRKLRSNNTKPLGYSCNQGDFSTKKSLFPTIFV